MTRPDFRSPEFLRNHVLHTMAFYDGRCVDPSGGFFHCFKDDGTVYDRGTRHLVSSTRFVVTHAWAAIHFPDHPQALAWRAAAAHGLRFIEEQHRQPNGGFAWLLHWDGRRATVLDNTNHCYGLAFVLLAYATALRAGLADARGGLDACAALMEHRFWEPAAQLYADEADAQWQLSAYRGQNANMHACEAMLAAFDATSDARYLQRASTLAESVTVRLAGPTNGLVWEHYDRRWQLDENYNRDDPANLFRPWGFQTGHLTEWAKLLLTLEAREPDEQSGLDRVPRARRLFERALLHGWDSQHGGLVYGFAGASDATGQDGSFRVCDGHKYFWVQAESLAAAARIAQRCGDASACDWYDRLWTYAWDHFVDHDHGAWYRILSPDNRKLSDEKSPPGKTDYHTMGACYDVLDALRTRLGAGPRA